MKILALVLYNESGCYEEFGKQWLRLVGKVPNVEFYLYKENPNIKEEYEISGNIITVRTREDYRQLLGKFILALKAFEPRFNEFDFIWRGSCSSIMHWKKYMAYLESIPRGIVLEGVHIHCYGYCYCSGAGFAVTPEFARIIIANPQDDHYSDDLTVGKIGKENDVNLVKRPREYAIVRDNNWETFLENLNGDDPLEFHYRFRTDSRKDDVERYILFMNKYIDNIGR